MEARKVLVKEGDIATITCPFCRRTKQLSVAQFKEKRKRNLRVKCRCDKIFNLCLEYRKHPRKPVRLLGKSINLSSHMPRTTAIEVNNIPLMVLSFLLLKKTIGIIKLQTTISQK